MIKELRKQISDANLLKIKIYGLCAAFSFVFSIFNVTLATFGHMHDMMFVVPFCALFAILGIIGFIAFIVNACEVLESSLK